MMRSMFLAVGLKSQKFEKQLHSVVTVLLKGDSIKLNIQKFLPGNPRCSVWLKGRLIFWLISTFHYSSSRNPSQRLNTLFMSTQQAPSPYCAAWEQSKFSCHLVSAHCLDQDYNEIPQYSTFKNLLCNSAKMRLSHTCYIWMWGRVELVFKDSGQAL